MQIGPFSLPNQVVLAPMAGVTDRPFRRLCRRLGAGLTVSEMVTSDPRLRATPKTLRRIDHQGEPAPRSVQIAGADPAYLADAARFNVERGADLIDVNMGCPAKKVCNAAAGSALLSDEALVARILERVVAAVAVPVTLKIRTGPAPDRRNAVRIARIAESAGIAAVAVHGRTRRCAFKGAVEYESIRAVKRAVSIPVIANGDVTSPEQARRVLAFTGADAVMIGRAAQGNPGCPARSPGISDRARSPSRRGCRSGPRCCLRICARFMPSTARPPESGSRASTCPGTAGRTRKASGSGATSTMSNARGASSP